MSLLEIEKLNLEIGGAPILSVVAWSRILAEREVICAMNTDPHQDRTAWVTVDASLHHTGDALPVPVP